MTLGFERYSLHHVFYLINVTALINPVKVALREC